MWKEGSGTSKSFRTYFQEEAWKNYNRRMQEAHEEEMERVVSFFLVNLSCWMSYWLYLWNPAEHTISVFGYLVSLCVPADITLNVLDCFP